MQQVNKNVSSKGKRDKSKTIMMQPEAHPPKTTHFSLRSLYVYMEMLRERMNKGYAFNL